MHWQRNGRNFVASLLVVDSGTPLDRTWTGKHRSAVDNTFCGRDRRVRLRLRGNL